MSEFDPTEDAIDQIEGDNWIFSCEIDGEVYYAIAKHQGEALKLIMDGEWFDELSYFADFQKPLTIHQLSVEEMCELTYQYEDDKTRPFAEELARDESTRMLCSTAWLE